MHRPCRPTDTSKIGGFPPLQDRCKTPATPPLSPDPYGHTPYAQLCGTDPSRPSTLAFFKQSSFTTQQNWQSNSYPHKRDNQCLGLFFSLSLKSLARFSRTSFV